MRNKIISWIFYIKIISHDTFLKVVESVGEVNFLDHFIVDGVEHLVEFALLLQKFPVIDFKLTSVVCMVYNAL